MLTIEEIKNYLNMPELPIAHTNSERNFYVKKIYDDYYCSNHDQSIIIRAFDDFELISVSTSRYFTVYLNDVVILTYAGDHSYNSDVFKIFDGLPFMTLIPEHFDFFVNEVNTKGQDCIVYFDRMSEKSIDYEGDQNISILYVSLKEKKYKDKSFYKIVKGELLHSYGFYTNQYFGNNEYKKYFNKIAYLKQYYQLYTLMIYQSIDAQNVRFLLNNYDFEIILNNSANNTQLFTEPNHSVAYQYEKNKRHSAISVDTTGATDCIEALMDQLINILFKEYPCAEFSQFLSEAGRYHSSLTDHEFDDYIQLFRMSTI
jgi:hypothetical protein